MLRYVAYHKETTRLLCKHPYTTGNAESYATEAAAKAAITRETNSNRALKHGLNANDFAVAEMEHFHNNIEKLVTKKNLMTGKEFQQPTNTPHCCDPSNETYWSM